MRPGAIRRAEACGWGRPERMLVYDMLASNRWLVVLGAAVTAIVVASVAVAVLFGDDEQTFPEGTPEAAVQTYLRAVRDRDAATASASFTAELRDRCEAEQLRRSYCYGRGFGARIRDSHERGDLVEVDVRISEPGDGGPFGGDGYHHDHVVVLTRVDGTWLISEPPWPVEYCPPAPPAAASRSQQRASEGG